MENNYNDKNCGDAGGYGELYEKLSRLQWLLQRYHMQNHSEHGPFADPTRGQGRVLAMLKLQPEISTKDLSYLLGIRQQSLNELLNKLEKGGYIERTPSEADRRVMMVRLTEKGREGKQADPDISGIFDCLTEEERTFFGDYLDRVIAALEARVGSETSEEAMEEWLRAARARVGDGIFEHMKAMRGGFRHEREGRGGDRDMCGFGRFDDMPGPDSRFDSERDGPMPGYGGCDHRGPRNPPPPPPRERPLEGEED